jgi:hypothetical protein
MGTEYLYVLEKLIWKGRDMKNIDRTSRLVICGLIILLIGTMAAQGQEAITGTITDADGNPISGATVTNVELDASAETDPNGAYTFQDVPAGTYTVQVEVEGYVTAEQSVTIVENVTPGAVDFILTKTEEEAFPWLYIIILLVLIIGIGGWIAYNRSKKETCGKEIECPNCDAVFVCTKVLGHEDPCDEIRPHPCIIKCPGHGRDFPCGKGDCGHGGPHGDYPQHICNKSYQCPNCDQAIFCKDDCHPGDCPKRFHPCPKKQQCQVCFIFVQCRLRCHEGACDFSHDCKP